MRDFPDEFQLPVRVLGGDDTGIRGYLKGSRGLKAQINLASQPFRRDRVFLVSSAAIAAGLVVLLFVLISIAVNDRRQMQASLAALDSRQSRTGQHRRPTAQG